MQCALVTTRPAPPQMIPVPLPLSPLRTSTTASRNSSASPFRFDDALRAEPSIEAIILRLGDRHDQQTTIVPELMLLHQRSGQRNRLDGHPDERTPNVATLEKLVENAIDRLRRQRHWSSASERGIVESEHGTGRIDERSARESVVHGQVEPENSVDASALPTAPPCADGADNAEAGG